MQQTAYSDQRRLAEYFNAAIIGQQNIVLQAENLHDPAREFARSVAAGLAARPRELECRFLYDAAGSAIYEEICAQPEYYPTRTEAGILSKWAAEIAALTGPCTLIELGSGSSVKTGHLLSAYQELCGNVCYIPIDISGNALKYAGRAIIDRHPNVQVVGVNGTYGDSFPLIRCASPALVIFLGSTIGNFKPEEESRFLSEISANMQAGDYFLLGIDLIKDAGLLEAAYNDRAGVTARFTRNYFARMNRELGAGINLDAVAHRAFYNADLERVEISAEFRDGQEIRIEPLRKSFAVQPGEKILLEISRKFNPVKVRKRVSRHGFREVVTFTDERGWFGLLLLEKQGA